MIDFYTLRCTHFDRYTLKEACTGNVLFVVLFDLILLSDLEAQLNAADSSSAAKANPSKDKADAHPDTKPLKAHDTNTKISDVPDKVVYQDEGVD